MIVKSTRLKAMQPCVQEILKEGNSPDPRRTET